MRIRMQIESVPSGFQAAPSSIQTDARVQANWNVMMWLVVMMNGHMHLLNNRHWYMRDHRHMLHYRHWLIDWHSFHMMMVNVIGVHMIWYMHYHVVANKIRETERN